VKRHKQTETAWATTDAVQALETDVSKKSRGGKRAKRRKIRSEGVNGLTTYEDVEIEDVVSQCYQQAHLLFS
jgi:hypothetical protein